MAKIKSKYSHLDDEIKEMLDKGLKVTEIANKFYPDSYVDRENVRKRASKFKHESRKKPINFSKLLSESPNMAGMIQECEAAGINPSKVSHGS